LETGRQFPIPSFQFHSFIGTKREAIFARTCCERDSSSLRVNPRVGMGGWTIISTCPDRTRYVSGFRTARVPTKVIGTMGTPESIARWKLPGLNGPSCPVRLRLPSGKRTTDLPSRTFCAACSRLLRAPRGRPRSTGMCPERLKCQPRNGKLNNERLARNRNCAGKWTNRTGMSMALWWFTQKMVVSSGWTFSNPSTRTWMPLVFRISHDQTRAQACCQRPRASSREPQSEKVPHTAV